MKCKCGNHYHNDHGCGVAVGIGSCYADHGMRCKLSNTYMPSYVKNESGCLPSLPEVGSKDYQYTPWESPANVGMCPWCWHKENDKREEK